MKLLYVDAQGIYLNPSATYLPVLFQEAVPGCHFFGPGFSSEADLAAGLQRWVERTGPYDVLMVGPNTPLLADDPTSAVEGAVRHMARYTVQSAPPATLAAFFRDVQQSYAGLEIPIKVVSGLTFDYYAATPRQVERLQQHKLAVLAPNAQFSQPLAQLPAFASQEEHFQRKKDRLSDRWHDYISAAPERVITSLHYVLPHEFSFTPIAERGAAVSIPGAEYLLRREAGRQLRQRGIRPASKWYFHAYRAANHLGLPVYSRALSLRLYNQLFLRDLANTRFVYTAKGGFGMPIRKYFEIPAAGAVLVCWPCNCSDALGLRPGEHYIPAEPQELADVLTRLKTEPCLQTIADAGQRLVAERHSLSARAGQVAACLRSMVAGRYAGARWEVGQFRVLERS